MSSAQALRAQLDSIKRQQAALEDSRRQKEVEMQQREEERDAELKYLEEQLAAAEEKEMLLAAEEKMEEDEDEDLGRNNANHGTYSTDEELPGVEQDGNSVLQTLKAIDGLLDRLESDDYRVPLTDHCRSLSVEGVRRAMVKNETLRALHSGKKMR